ERGGEYSAGEFISVFRNFPHDNYRVSQLYRNPESDCFSPDAALRRKRRELCSVFGFRRIAGVFVWIYPANDGSNGFAVNEFYAGRNGRGIVGSLVCPINRNFSYCRNQ